MSRARVPESLLAGAATAVVAWPLTTLFAPSTWVRPTLGLIAVVVVCGMLARLVTGSAALVALAQLVGLVLVSSWLYGQGHLWRGLPTPDMVLAFNNLLVDARLTIQNYAAPAPTTRGITLAIGLAIGVTAIVVDHLAVMRRSPALAGLPLLTAFLVSASNSGESLPPAYFVVAAGVWLMMLGRQGIASLRRWSTTVPMSTAGRRHTDDREGVYGYAAVGRTLAVAGLAAAVVLPLAVPHFPTRYLIDGLGRSTGAAGFSDGEIGLRTTLDLAKSLSDPSKAAVLKYTSNAPTTTPLRVGVLDTYSDDTWKPSSPDVRYGRRTQVSPPSELSRDVPRETYRIAVDDSRIEAPQIAAPTPIVSADLDVPWGLDRATQVASVDRSESSYSFSYLGLAPTEDSLAQSRGGDQQGDFTSEDLAVDPASEGLVRSIVDQIVPANASRIEAARDIQKYLRSDGGFTYSLKLPQTVTNAAGQVERPDAISLFLRSKIGYCVQFATAMVMMARASGIPARMAIGFLPGTVDRGTYTVRASDAHAWPELYFNGIGWLRFEPTPSGTQNTVAPAYTFPPTRSDGSQQPALTATGAPSLANNRPDSRNDPGATDAAGTTPGSSGFRALLGPQGRTIGTWALVGLLVGLLGALAVPLAARSRLRRRLRLAPDEATRVEVEWQSMVDRIADLGVIPPRGSTPRQAGRFFRREAYLEGEESQALGRVVEGVELSRYARPGTSTLADIRTDTEAVVKAVSGVRRRKDRARAMWWPAEGVSEWRERRARAARLLRRPWERFGQWRRGEG
jgi:transglutaminase-like putative cysteine protease